MLRVLMLITDLQKGGTPLRLVRTARRLPDVGVRPIVASLAREGPLAADLRAAGIDAFSCGARHRLDAGCLPRLARLIRDLDPDLVHATLFHANLAARAVGRLDRARPIITASATIEVERPLHRLLESLTCRASDRHLANSRAVARHLVKDLGFPAQRVAVVPNVLDLDALDRATPIDRMGENLPPDVPLLVWAGRMDPVKRLPLLVRALACLKRSIDFRAVLLGDGPHRRSVESAVRDGGLTGFVRLPGWRDDVARWLKSAEVFVLPSRTEGAPNALLEAMACGCCVVASDIPACREALDPGVTGLLCDADDPEPYAEAILALLHDPVRRQSMAQAAGVCVQTHHNPQTIVARLADLYRSTVADARTLPR